MHVPISLAIDWIAYNEGDVDPDNMDNTACLMTVVLVADLFGKDQMDIARRVVKRYKEIWQ